MKKIVLIFPLALAACVAQPEPIQDYDAPIGKYEIARPAVLSAVVYAIRGWARCPQDTPKWPHGLYRADADPMPACDDNGSDSTFTITERPPTHQPPTHRPPTHRPPTSKPPTEKPPTGKPPHEPRVKKNNGLGDGDQEAPGRSLAHNRAENQVGSTVHRGSGKPQNSN